MKLLSQSNDGFQYQLSPEEAHLLRLLVRQFPVAAFSPAVISKMDCRASEREKLLNESLAAHRVELKQKAGDLVGEDKFKTMEGRRLFRLGREAREILLQVLNDIRVESWRILGGPENLNLNLSSLPKENIRHYQLMELAGYFEYHFLNLEGEDKK